MTTPTIIRVMCVDDHPLVREGIGGLLSTAEDIELVAQASNGLEALQRFREFQPDITLMDLQMPTMGGINAMMAIRDEFPKARIVVLTTYSGDALVQRALKTGASAYVLKSEVRTDLVETIRAVNAGRKVFAPGIALQLADHTNDEQLSAREIEVLELIASGHSNKRIARALGITEGTVKNHVKAIIAKLCVKDRTHAVTAGMQRGVIGF
jgi:DNA-binding NarL/FixJ family response regulator